MTGWRSDCSFDSETSHDVDPTRWNELISDILTGSNEQQCNPTTATTMQEVAISTAPSITLKALLEAVKKYQEKHPGQKIPSLCDLIRYSCSSAEKDSCSSAEKDSCSSAEKAAAEKAAAVANAAAEAKANAAAESKQDPESALSNSSSPQMIVADRHDAHMSPRASHDAHLSSRPSEYIKSIDHTELRKQGLHNVGFMMVSKLPPKDAHLCRAMATREEVAQLCSATCLLKTKIEVDEVKVENVLAGFSNCMTEMGEKYCAAGETVLADAVDARSS